jgi:hypothetical protein
MEQALKHLNKYALYYTLILIIVCCLGYIAFLRYRTLEKFQDMEQETTGNAPVQASQEVCEQLQAQIDQYTEVKDKHKDIVIGNMDETIAMLQKFFKQYMCDTYVSGS